MIRRPAAWLLGVALTLAAAPSAAPAADAPPPNDPPLATGRILDPVASRAHPEQTYALYLPSRYTPAARWPVLYAFDARQRGGFVAERYREAAEELGWIVVSSNHSRSDESMQPNIDAMRAMWDDSHARLSIDPRRAYATGFSGGARAAVLLAIAQRGAVAGVIGHGGGYPFERPPSADQGFAFYGLAGWHDFNYPELLRLDERLAALGLDHAFEPFEGRHEWAPAGAARRSLAWMELAAMRRGLTATRPDFVERFFEDSVAAAEAAERDGDPVLAARRWSAIERDFRGLRSIEPATARRQALEATPGYLAERDLQARAEAEHAAFVEAARQRLAGLLAEPEPEAIRPERAAAILDVPAVREIEAGDPSIYRRRAARRSLEALYVQTAFYVPRDLQAKREFARAVLCLGIATQVKPEEPWAWVSLGRGRALAGDEKGAVAALRRAVDLGLAERRWIEEEPAFDRLAGRRDFRQLMADLP